MKLLIFSQLQQYDRYSLEWISNLSHIILGMWLLIHAGIEVSKVSKKGWGSWSQNRCRYFDSCKLIFHNEMSPVEIKFIQSL